MKRLFLPFLFGALRLLNAQTNTNYNYVGLGDDPIYGLNWNLASNWVDDLSNPSTNPNGCSSCKYTIGNPAYSSSFFNQLFLTESLDAARIYNFRDSQITVGVVDGPFNMTLHPDQTTVGLGNIVGSFNIQEPRVKVSPSNMQFPLVFNGNVALTATNSPLILNSHDLTLRSGKSLLGSPILQITSPIQFSPSVVSPYDIGALPSEKLQYKLNFVFEGDYLQTSNSTQIALQVGPGCSGVVLPTECSHDSCSSEGNVTYDLFVSEIANCLGLTIDTSNATIQRALKNVQIASFPNGFGTYYGINGSDGCCYNSPGLEVSNGFLSATLTIFDPTANPDAKFIIVDSPYNSYTLSWSDYSPSQYNSAQYSSSGPGYPGYGVNGVFGLWVDAVSKPFLAAHMTGASSQNNTATMLNTMNKANDLQQRAQSCLDQAEMGSSKRKIAFNDVLDQSLLAQQSVVQQLAERNLQSPVKHWSVYVEPRGSWGQVFKQNNHLGNKIQTVGTRAGFDYLWTNEKNEIPVSVGLGFVADYLHFWGQRNQASGNFHVDEGLANVYITIVPKSVRELSVNLIGGGGYSWYTFHRDLFADSSVIATGKTKGPDADFFFEIEYVFRHKRFSRLPQNYKIAPIAALQYTYTKVDGYTERGAGKYNLHVNGHDISTLSTLLGFRTNYEWIANLHVSVCPELKILWQYQYLDPSITSTATYVIPQIGPDLVVETLPGIPRNTLVVGANIKMDLFDCATVRLDYDFFYNTGFITNVFFLELKGEF